MIYMLLLSGLNILLFIVRSFWPSVVSYFTYEAACTFSRVFAEKETS